ncbi:MAG: flagellar motor switch protein FliM [Rhodothermales bacterium]
MSKLLNQNEIDALLGVSDEDEAKNLDLDELNSLMLADLHRNVSPYNFKRPRLFSQDQMRVMNQVHEAFARDLSVYLSAQLRTIVEITLTAMDQVLYSEFVMSSAHPSALFVVEVVDRGQQLVFEMDPRLVIFTIEKLFGGTGRFLRKPRETSQIEQRIMSKVMARAFQELEKAWSQVAEMQFRESAFESNAEFVQIIPGSEPAIIGTFEVRVYEHHSFMNVCYPYIMLERVLGRAGMKQWLTSATTEVPSDVRDEYNFTLQTMDVSMRAELGRTTLSITDLLGLSEGDVILLKNRADEPIKVYIGELPKFKASAGKSGNQRAVRVVEILDTDISGTNKNE